jgi:hypothetical protein
MPAKTPIRQVAIGALRVGGDAKAGNGNEGHQHPIAHQQRDEYDDQPAQAQIDEQQRRKQIAEREALQHAEQTDVGPLVGGAAVVDHSQCEQQQETAQHP